MEITVNRRSGTPAEAAARLEAAKAAAEPDNVKEKLAGGDPVYAEPQQQASTRVCFESASYERSVLSWGQIVVRSQGRYDRQADYARASSCGGWIMAFI